MGKFHPVDMVWTFKYIMNGFAVQDLTLKADGNHFGSIRQYDAEEETWLVHYYSKAAPKATLPHWTGGKVGEELIFSRENTAPNGAEGTFRLRFYDMTINGFTGGLAHGSAKTNRSPILTGKLIVQEKASESRGAAAGAGEGG